MPTCNKCNKNRSNGIELVVQSLKEGPIKKYLCNKCLKELFVEIVTWNTDILNKAFNNTVNWINRETISSDSMSHGEKQNIN